MCEIKWQIEIGFYKNGVTVPKQKSRSLSSFSVGKDMFFRYLLLKEVQKYFPAQQI